MKKRIFSILTFFALFCLMFVNIVSAATIENIPSDYLPLPEIPEDYTYSHMYLTKSTVNNAVFLRYLHSNEPFEIDVSYLEGEFLYLSTSKDVRVSEFMLMDDGRWGTNGTYTKSAGETVKPRVAVVYSSTFNIYDEYGELFFEVPPTELYQMIQKVTEEGLATELTLGGTIRILVLCGVGLIALLMVLNLFGKVFNRYRN